MAKQENIKKQATGKAPRRGKTAHGSRVRTAAGSGRRAHLRPERREQIDASMIGLCYWLIAQRIVREAEEHGDLDCPEPEVHDLEAGEPS